MNSNPLIYSVGTQVVTLKDVYAQNHRVAHPAGAVGVIVQSPVDRLHAYRVKFADSFESPIHHDQLTRLADFKRVQIGSNETPINEALYDRVDDRDEIGTSFAAPKVAHIASRLQRVLPDESCLLYRVLIVQSARWPE